MECALVLPALGCCILLVIVPKMVLTLCNLHWWCCFPVPTSTITDEHMGMHCHLHCVAVVVVYV